MPVGVSPTLSRRLFLTGSTALAVSGCTTMAARRTSSASVSCLPRVNVSPERIIRTVAGLRPYRPSGYVVRAEPIGDRVIVHNYGHGGGGISLSWGSSREAIALGLPGHSGPVAVIGAGALGLTCARLLQEAGYPVSIYAKALPPNTTSNIAGGQIFPASFYDDDVATEEFLVRARTAAGYTRRRMQIMVGDDYGIRWLPTYDEIRWRSQPPANPMFPDRHLLGRDQHPFPSENLLEYSTMYVETGRFLASLMRDIRIAGGSVAVRDFSTPADVASLPERLVFNCTGLGASALFGDSELEPVRGQLAILIPQADIQYAYTVGAGYMFPRPDGIVLGGTFEHGEWLAEPQPGDIAAIVRRHADYVARWRCA